MKNNTHPQSLQTTPTYFIRKLEKRPETITSFKQEKQIGRHWKIVVIMPAKQVQYSGPCGSASRF